MAKIIGISIILMTSAWGFFDFNTAKPFTFIRYLLAFVQVYPLRFFGVILFLAASVYLCYQWLYKPAKTVAKTTYDRSEQLLTNAAAAAIPVQNIAGTTAYMRISKELDEPFKGSGIDDRLREFIVKWRRLHQNLPGEFLSNKRVSGTFRDLEPPTQIYEVMVIPWQHTLILVVHDPHMPDLNVTQVKPLPVIPDRLQLQKITASIPDHGYDQLIQAFYNWQHQNLNLYNEHTGFGIIGDGDSPNSFIIYLIPGQVRDFDFNKILYNAVGLEAPMKP